MKCSSAFVSHLKNLKLLKSVNRNRNRKLQISTASTKAKSRESAYSQALIRNKIDRQQVRSRESGRQTVRRWMVFGVDTGREVGRKGCCFNMVKETLMSLTYFNVKHSLPFSLGSLRILHNTGAWVLV